MRMEAQAGTISEHDAVSEAAVSFEPSRPTYTHHAVLPHLLRSRRPAAVVSLDHHFHL
jgi:hypothetical protein